MMKEILELPTTSLSVDLEKKIVVGTMNGDVHFQDYKKMLLAGTKLASLNKVDSIIIDRTHVEKLDAECRIWVKKTYFKVYVPPVVSKIRKVATVEPKSMIGKIYGAAIYKTLSLLFPNMTFRSFDRLEEALNWINPDNSKATLTIDKVIEDEKILFLDEKLAEKEESSINLEVSEQQQEILESGVYGQESSNTFFDKVVNLLFSR